MTRSQAGALAMQHAKLQLRKIKMPSAAQCSTVIHLTFNKSIIGPLRTALTSTTRC